MAKFPEPPPPGVLADISPDVKTLPVATLLWRVYFRGGRHPTFWNTFRAFGPTSGRFDHHLPPPRMQERTISYCAEHGPTCFAEVFQDTRVIDRAARHPWLAGFAVTRSVALLDLTQTWPTRAGASMAINSGPRPRARRWSRAIYDAYPHLEGLYYPSSMHANRPSVVLYDRAFAALPTAPVFHRPAIDQRC